VQLWTVAQQPTAGCSGKVHDTFYGTPKTATSASDCKAREQAKKRAFNRLIGFLPANLR
jgi:hypothetical protein